MGIASRIGAWHRLLACVTAVLFVSAIAGAAAAESVAQATKLRGEVLLTRGGADQPVALGTAFQTRDVIKTGAKARLQITFVDGSVVTLAENSMLSIDRFNYNAGTARSVSLSAVSGVLNALAAKSNEGRFDYQIKTGQGYSAVRGTNWFVAAGSAASTFYVVDGLVEVGTLSGSRAVVEAGNAVTVSAESGLGPKQPIPPEVMNELADATDPESANAAPSASEAPAAAPAQPAPDDESESDTPAAPSQKRQGGGGGGGGGGHGM